MKNASLQEKLKDIDNVGNRMLIIATLFSIQSLIAILMHGWEQVLLEIGLSGVFFILFLLPKKFKLESFLIVAVLYLIYNVLLVIGNGFYGVFAGILWKAIIIVQLVKGIQTTLAHRKKTKSIGLDILDELD